jgi:O-antigen/teichoic acid export membrane protein
VLVIKNLLNKPFVRHNVIFFIGSSVVSILNYLYYPILSHQLRPSDFGEVQALVSLFLQISIFLSVLGLVTVNIVTNIENENERNEIVFELEKLALYISLIGLVITLLLAAPIQHFLNFESESPIIVTYLALIIGVPLTFRAAFLRGKKDFTSASISNIIASFTKLLFSGALVYLGFRTSGAIGGIVVSQIVALVYTGIRAKNLGLNRLVKLTPLLPNLRLVAPELRYSLLVLVVSLVTTFAFSVDTIAVKHFFSPRTAGLYAGISTVARTIYYIAGPVVMVMLSFVKINNTARDNLRFLLATLALMLAIGGGTMLVFLTAPTAVVKILIGSQYTQYSSLLPSLGLVMLLLSIVSLVYSYFMALRRYAVGFLSIIGVLVTVTLLNFHHGSLPNIIEALLYSSVAMLLFVPAWLAALQARRFFS